MGSILAVAATGWGLMMSLAPLLQARIVIQRRDSSGTSIAWMIVLLVGFILWLCYGVAIGNMPLILTNVVSCTACTVTLAVVLRFRGEKATDGA
jgi:MtN3 and saliva related transmembrane protein